MSRKLVMAGLAWPFAIAGQDVERLFADKIQPVIEKDCAGCHGRGQTLAGLDLTTREGVLRGGQRGPALVPGNASASPLFQAVRQERELKMPPVGRLDPGVVEAIRAWIDGGAPWPSAEGTARWNHREEDVWAFRPLRRRFAHASIDDFLSERLSAKGIRAAARASRRTLIRRAAIDLTGLPPAPAEVAAFEKDTRPDAWERVVERLLASPRYGERWGRHWLDVVRYADTSGYSNDFERPNAWRYRDYVIRSFNNDKPYDRFVREQIAGDELYPGDSEAILATGFLRAGPWEHTGMSVEAVTRQMFLDDVTNAVGVTFLGVSLGCARCHDHKFDPIPARDYYAMQAVFATTEFARRNLPFLAAENTATLAPGREKMNQAVSQTQAGLKGFDEIAKANAMRKHGVARAEDLPPGALEKAIRDKEGISAEEYEHLKLYQKHLQLYRESLDRFAPKAFSVSSGPLDGETDGGPNLRYPKRAEYKSPDTFVLTGGNVQSPGARVAPGAIQAVARYGELPDPAIPAMVSGRRAALANWITDARNPLTARVMVNRIWQYHFGRGLAADANNLGKMGARPTHPELLDWLAAQFIARGWSVKEMHRLILHSEAYQRASEPADDVRTADPDNKLLSYFPPRRVEAEVLRDSILAVSGELSLEAGGPGVFPQINEDVARQPRHAMGSVQPAYHPSSRKRERNRRTVYSFQQRSLVDPLVDVFNGAGMDLSCERRDTSTVPTQAFSLFNSRFTHDMALAMARRLEREASSEAQRIGRAFELAYGRVPTSSELALSRRHLEKMRAWHRATPPPAREARKPVVHTITSELTGEEFRFVQRDDPSEIEENLRASEASPETRALADLALVLMNSNEFVYMY